MISIFTKLSFLYKSESSFIVICIFLLSKIKNIFIKSKIKNEKKKHQIILSKKIISNDYFSSSAFYFYNLLKKLPKNLKYLEIGSYEGNSALYVSTNFPNSNVTCVDLWEDVEEYKGKDFNIIEKNFDLNLKGLSNINKIKSTSDDFFIKNTIMYDFIYIDGPYDYSLLKKAIKLLPKNFVRETLIDAGANIGTVSIPAIKDGLFKNGIAFEPNHKIYNILKINIFLNNLNKEITPLDFCLSLKNNDNLSFNISKTNYGDTRFKRSSRNNLFPKNKVKKLDSFIKLVNPNKTLIKIDVQGFEPQVLLGSKLFLSFQPPLILEVDPIIINKNNFMIMLDILKKYYSYFFELDNKNLNKNNISLLEDSFFRLKKSKKLSNVLVIK